MNPLNRYSNWRAAAVTVSATVLVGLTSPAQALVINSTFVDSGNGGVFDLAAKAIVQSAISFYESAFSDPVTVSIQFHNDAYYWGGSWDPMYQFTYADIANALAGDASSASDTIALANLPTSLAPTSQIQISSANGRALGLNTPGGLLSDPSFCTFIGDGCIGLNVFGIRDWAVYAAGFGVIIDPDQMFRAVVEHEIDEVLGLGSGLQAGYTDVMHAEDLFRYSGAGTLSYATNANCTNAPAANFSIDGGVTNLNQFNNCDNGGDYGDWIEHNPSQVNDWRGGNGVQPSLNASSTEVVALDVIGWTRSSQQSVPEPGTMSLFGVAFLAIFATRRRFNNNGHRHSVQ